MASRRFLTVSTTLSLALLPLLSAQAAAEPKVVASIKPVHALVASVMEGVGTPDLIVGGAASPHAYALKPSQARALENADLIFWIGHELESFLVKPVETIGSKARAVELIDSDGVIQLPFREGGSFDEHAHEEHADGHDDHGDEKHQEHAHDHEDHEGQVHDEHAEGQGDHDGEKHEGHAHGHDDHEGEKHEEHADGHGKHEGEKHEGHAHDHAGGFDAHLWLDPLNAKIFVKTIGEALSDTDPENASTYAANVAKTNQKLDALIEEVNTNLAPVRGKQFIVFHDAYQYFEKRFDMVAAGSITVNPEVRPSAERVAAIRDKVQKLNAACAFSEPQFDGQLIDVAIEGSEARTAVLDPLGATLDDGPELYFDLIRNLATSMRDCLAAG
ncbi:zinc transport system substrate-binding protein [Hoeflea halophila]|uniref:High-affinity zinc uptake system protein ZnuA n=1 Tax=Hoeflea halophila TaxID=714899 RepID=A0A286IBW7_9HYPH|nr:zinc ABC transporter substrate-binding protein [Hoeflea halophila]SOE17615.1 zinc transport system substrate-binding protein [Hoeflea halophila]